MFSFIFLSHCSLHYHIVYFYGKYQEEIPSGCYSPADKPKNCSLFDKSTKIGMHVILIILNHLR